MNNRKILTFAVKIASAKVIEPRLPWRVNLAITNLCNARCVMCNVWRLYRENPQLVYEELSLEHITKLFSELGSHLLWLHITGGEPFLRRDLVKIIEIAIKNCKNLLIIDTSTNGLMPETIKNVTEQIIQLLQDNRVVFGIGVSIDGPPKIHNYMRGVDKAWEQAIRTLRLLKELEKSYNNCHVHVNYTITRYNAGYLAETYDNLQRMVDLSPNEISVSLEHSGIQFQNLNRIPRYDDIRNRILKDLSWVWEKSRDEKLLKNIVTWIRAKFKSAFVRLAIQYTSEPTKMVLPCEALRSSIFIDPYGNVYPCTIWNIKLGNIKTSSLKEILHDSTAINARKAILRGKCPNCWSGCESWPTMLVRYWKALLQ